MFSKKRMSLPRQWQGPAHLEESGFDMARVRNPVTRSRGLVRGQFPSIKSKRMVAWESQLEEKACYLFEFAPAVLSLREQPVKIEYVFEGRVRTYIPDFEVTYRNGLVCYIEIKPLQKLLSQEHSDRFRCIAQTFNRYGCVWRAITEVDLPSPIALRNLKLLRTYLPRPLPAATIQKVQHWLANTDTPTLAMLKRYISSTSVALSLIARGIVAIDRSQPIDDSTKLISMEEGQHATRLFTGRSAPDFEPRELSYSADTGRRYFSAGAPKGFCST